MLLKLLRGSRHAIPTIAAPSWFLALPEKQWAQVPMTNTLTAAWPNVPDAPDGGPGSVLGTFMGGSIDQTRAEFIFANNGGHTDGDDNGVYCIRLREENPYWVCLAHPTPDSLIPQLVSAGQDDHAYLDGHPRSHHGWTRAQYANGRVWLAGLTGMAAGNAGSCTAIYSFNRDSIGSSINVPYTEAPWTFHGLSHDPLPSNWTSIEGSPAAYDRVDNLIWACANTAPGTIDQHIWSVTADSNATVMKWNRNGSVYTGLGNPSLGGWAQVAWERRLLIVTEFNTVRVWIGDLTDMSKGMLRITTTGDVPANGAGGVYHQPSNAILSWQRTYGANVRKLPIPDDPWSDPWVWETITSTEGGVTPDCINNNGFTYNGALSKFNLIENMGNGISALVGAYHRNGPVYIYRLPVGELT